MGLFDAFKKKAATAESRNTSSYSDPEVLLYERNEYVTRDNFKPKEYYLKELDRTNRFLALFKENFEAGKYENSYYYGECRWRVLLKIRTLYILGASMDDLRPHVLKYFEYVKELPRSVYAFGYNQMVEGLALWILFDLRPEELTPYREVPFKESDVDARLDILQNWAYGGKVECTKDFYWKDTLNDAFRKGSQGFMNMVHAAPEEREAAFLAFLDTDVNAFFKRRLREWERLGENRYTYTGAFDLGYTAIAKVYGFDKAPLASSPFIAVDML